MAEEKKKFWDEQTFSVNKFIKKINDYKNIFVGYLNEEEIFFKNCLKMISNILINFDENINKLLDFLLSYNQTYGDSIKKFEDFKSKNNNYDNKIKEIIKGILSLERKHFNEKNKGEIETFLSDPKFCVPSLKSIQLNTVQLDKYNINFIKEKTIKLRNSYLGVYEFKFLQNPITKDVNCTFNFILKEDDDISAFVTLIKQDKEGYLKGFPLKFMKKEGQKYFYQSTIPFEEFKEGISRSYKFRPNINLFSV